MHKEVLFAIIFGSMLGLVVAYGVWRANATLTASNELPSDSNSQEQQESASLASSGGSVSISSPTESEVLFSSPVTVTGVTNANTTVAFSSTVEDYFSKSNSSGEFSQNIDLVNGINTIYVYSVSEDGNVNRTQFNVIYYDELSEDLVDSTEASESASIEERVRERIERASTVLGAYIGTITDITENTIQVRTRDGDIQQLATEESTGYANIVAEKKQVSAEDLAIGDYVIAIGFVDEKKVLHASRILVDSPEESIERNVFMADVTDVSRNQFTASARPNPDDYSVDTSDTEDVISTNSKEEIVSIRLSNIEDGDKVLVYGSGNQDSFKARTVYIYPSD